MINEESPSLSNNNIMSNHQESSSVSSACEQNYTAGPSNGSGEHSTTTGTDSTLSREEQEELVAKETKHIRRSRACFVVILFATACVAGAITFIYASREERNDFESEVRNTHILLDGTSKSFFSNLSA